MCNLYSFTKSQRAIRVIRITGNLLLLPDIFPDYQAPIVRINNGPTR